ncbi:type I secretion system permease/ATPase [Siccirubricoccus sp. KC 17139]|uniref:Type I secretion system permease/ATPase n=1 Tax=Siccirubricoccus soli TaxID=2899147 RepID=A0ABT1DEU0_9PROT|nr:type I secretion system permease/ATPase [Siccirubricoccus soli]MCO6419729.1 type I secretion system permease/ATPase [Siccirubricoccus soli]MCP2685864.1 type I secretion system permease/ATPase [Siccirubricoccus soli]
MTSVALGRMGRRGVENALSGAIRACRSSAWMLAAFSFAINLLLLGPSLYMLQVYDRVLATGRVETLLGLTVLIAAALLLYGLLEGLRSAIVVRMATWLGARLGPVYLEAGVRARLVGDAAGAQPMRDLSTVQAFMASPSLTGIFDILWSPAYLVLVWMLHPLLGSVALASVALLFCLGLLNEYVTRSQNARASLAQIVAAQQADAMIRNAETVRAMGMLPALVERWCRSGAAGTAAWQRAGETSAWLLGVTKFARNLVQSVLLGLGAYLVLRNEMSGGGMIASSILLSRALGPIEGAMSNWRNFVSTRLAYRRLKSRLESLPAEPLRTRLPAPVGRVTLDRVTYVPPGARAAVLTQVSLTAQPGEAIAVIGPSGGGKSTLCRILVGVAEPTAGEVRLDGSELAHWNPAELGRHIGYLPQEVELFGGTIRENIARMGAADDEQVVEAAMLAHAHELIQRLPEGYDTPIGEGGLRLSAGQRQRIGLARAVYGMPRLIVLDEPNANLDQAGESALGAAIENLKQAGATVVIVGHRPSTIVQADKILLLKHGRVADFGPRDEILKRLRIAAADGSSAPEGVPEHQRA